MKTYSFNYSGQLCGVFFKLTCSLLFSFSKITVRLVCINNRGANTTVQINMKLLLWYTLSIIAHLLFLNPTYCGQLFLLVMMGCFPPDLGTNTMINIEHRMLDMTQTRPLNVHRWAPISPLSFLPPSLPPFLLSFLPSFLPSSLPSFLLSFLPSFLPSSPFPPSLPSFTTSLVYISKSLRFQIQLSICKCLFYAQ